MESPHWFEPDDAGGEVLRESRQRLLWQAYDVFELATVLTDLHEGVYVSREPLAVPGHEDAVSILLTRDGERPFIDETDKEYIKLYFVRADFINDEPREAEFEDGLMWIEEYRQGDMRRYLLTEQSFEQYQTENEMGSMGADSADRPTEATELRRFRERLERFQLTPHK